MLKFIYGTSALGAGFLSVAPGKILSAQEAARPRRRVGEPAALNYRDIKYLVSYDGRTGNRVHGRKLPESLRLHLVELHAGRSSQATLLGRSPIERDGLGDCGGQQSDRGGQQQSGQKGFHGWPILFI